MPIAPGRSSSSRDFRLLWLAQTSSLAGVQFGIVAIPLTAVLTLDASPAQVGLLTSLSSASWLILGVFVGPLVDRVAFRRSIIFSHVLRAALLASVAVLAMSGTLGMAYLYCAVFAVGALSMVFETAYQALLPTMSARDELGPRNGKLAVTDGLSRTAGPSLAGYVVDALSSSAALLTQSAGYALAGVATACMTPADGQRGERRRLSTGSLRGTASFLWGEKTVRAMLLSEVGYLYFFNIAFAVIMVFFVRELGMTAMLVGLIFAAGSVGGILSGVVSVHLSHLPLRQHLIVGSTVRAMGLALMPLAVFMDGQEVYFLAGARFLNSFGWTLWEVRKRTETQLRSPEERLGRIQGLFLFCSRSGEALGALTGALSAALIGTIPTVVTGCLGCVLSVAVAWTTPPVPAPDAEGPDAGHGSPS
ncbi:MAG: MFS transporter [Brachybacterium tyrofermentans]